MQNVKSKIRREIIAHRGISQKNPENTLAAILETLKTSVDGIEIDIHLSKDGIPVLLHDPTLEHAAGIEGAVSDFSYQELKSFPLWGDHVIASLEEVLSLVADKKRLFIEVKRELDEYPDPIPVVLEVLQNYKQFIENQSILVGSYQTNCLIEARRLWPSLSLIGIADVPEEAEKHLAAAQPERIALWYEYYTPYQIEDFAQKNVIPWTFTINSPEKAQFLDFLGVQGFISDTPLEIFK